VRDPVYDFMKQHFKGKFDADRKRFLNNAIALDDGGWIKHTEFHWSRIVDGKRLDYWPSRKKYMIDGKVRRGDVYAVIAAHKEKNRG